MKQCIKIYQNTLVSELAKFLARLHFLHRGNIADLDVQQHLSERLSERVRPHGGDPSAVEDVLQQEVDCMDARHFEAGHVAAVPTVGKKVGKVLPDGVGREAALDVGQKCGVPRDHAHVAAVPCGTAWEDRSQNLSTLANLKAS